MSDILARLMASANPVIRWRTATELADDPAAYDLSALRRDLLQSSLVRTWLGHCGYDRIHGSKAGCVENAAAKLLELGLGAGFREFDDRMGVWRRAMAEGGLATPHNGLNRSILAWVLLWAGYTDAAIIDFCLARLHDLAAVCAERSPANIYVDPDEHAGIPTAFRDRPLIDPSLIADGWDRVPSLHDVMWLAHLPDAALTDESRSQREVVIRWVLADEYQALPPGFGVMETTPGQFHAVGWRLDLPGWNGFDAPDLDPTPLVLRTELMSRFRVAREHPWFAAALRHLDSYRRDDGLWYLPAAYLRDVDPGYYVSGRRMGMSEGRRTQQVLAEEATLRMTLVWTRTSI